MGLTVVLGAKRSVELSAVELADRIERAGGGPVVVDLGTGDGRHPYHQAGARPDAFVVGVDAVAANLAEVAAKAGRKPAKGGRPNLLLVQASAEALPAELDGLADEVSVLLPWGSLLEGIVLGRPEILEGLARLAAPGARVWVVLNAEIWHENTPGRFDALPLPDEAHLAAVVLPAFEAAGLAVEAHGPMPGEEARALGTTWAKRLASSRPDGPRYVAIEARA